MKFLLAALNAKYIHSNPGVYSLKAYTQKWLEEPELSDGRFEIEIGEYTINNQIDEILSDIYRRKPDAVGFSCYIWNISYILELVRDLPKVLPHVEIWLGGPEVSYDAARILEEEPNVFGIMMGEGEETLKKWSAAIWISREVLQGGIRQPFRRLTEPLFGIKMENRRSIL